SNIRFCMILFVAAFARTPAPAATPTITRLSDNDPGGTIDLALVVYDIVSPPIITLNVVIEPIARAPTGSEFDDPIDPNFTGDFGGILAENGLTRFDVSDVEFARAEQTEEVTSENVTEAHTTPDLAFMGDLDPLEGLHDIMDPSEFPDVANVIFDGIEVESGAIAATTTLTTTHIPHFKDTLTIQTFTTPTIATLSDDDPGGTIDLTLIAYDIVKPPIVDLKVDFELTDTPPTGVAFDGPIDPNFTGDFDGILAANRLTRFDVSHVEFARSDQPEEVTSENTTYLNASDGFAFIGDLDSLLDLDEIEDASEFPGVAEAIFEEILVLSGGLSVNTTRTITHIPHFEDTLTIQLFKGAEPNPVTTLDLCPPPNGDGRIDACDLLLLIEAMRGGTIPEREIFEVSREWLSEEPFG
ncbi:MAG: hypothetical protein KC944_15390, partial [Candidatus Omnitrophica bacterium]|nr:hypothetical protein [Candidatus Omnitrophota bacterium]